MDIKPFLVSEDSVKYMLHKLCKCAVLVTIFVLASGCVTANFTQPIASFQSSVATSGAALATYYSQMNDFETEVYLDNVRFSNSKIEAIDAASHLPTPLLGAEFPGKSIKARLDLINTLGAYVQTLTDLENSKTPTQFSAAAKQLGTSLTNLATTFNATKDSTAVSYVGPISQLVGVLGQQILAGQEEQALIKAINDGSPIVDTILNLFKNDFAKVIQPLETTGIQNEVSNRIVAYNSRVDGANDADPKKRQEFPDRDRLGALNDIRSTLYRYVAIEAANPEGLIEAMRNSKNALVKYANSNKSPTDLASLTAALQTFQNNAASVATAVEAIKDVKKGAAK